VSFNNLYRYRKSNAVFYYVGLNYENKRFFIFISFPGDLFDILLPMLTIYQEYVRNHHYSLQVLTECKQNPAFVNLLERLENKPACHARSLENFLIVPMHQVKLIIGVKL